MNELLSTRSESGPSWEDIGPHLDAALGELTDSDRDALLLRYFERKSARQMAAALSISDEAAQKRVSRAVERLRELLAKRGVTVGAGGLVVLIAANGVQAAPLGLAVTISSALLTAASLASTATVTATATATVTKAIAMTTLQKSIIGATLAAAVGTGVYEAHQASSYRTQVETLAQQQAPLAEQVRQLQEERDKATNKVVALTDEVERLNRNTAELVKLRAETARLRALKEPTGTNAARPALSASSSSDKAPGDVAQLTQEAWQLLNTGHRAEALSKFESVVKLDPANSGAWNGLGWASFNSGKSQEAEKAFQKVIELEPEHPAALNGLGQLYLSQKKYDEAEPYLLKAGPKAPAAWFGLARLYLLQDKFDQAEHWAQAIIDSGQGDESARAMLKAAKDKKVSDALRLMIEPQ